MLMDDRWFVYLDFDDLALGMVAQELRTIILSFFNSKIERCLVELRSFLFEIRY